MTKDQMEAKIQELEAEVARKSAARPLTCKVSAKGALSLYGMGRFPVTLYAGQWERVLAFAPEIDNFLKVNASKFSRKE
jgi:hypothetical protein